MPPAAGDPASDPVVIGMLLYLRRLRFGTARGSGLCGTLASHWAAAGHEQPDRASPLMDYIINI